jgi:hypothetical protein
MQELARMGWISLAKSIVRPAAGGSGATSARIAKVAAANDDIHAPIVARRMP